jgi:hypothetical protein
MKIRHDNTYNKEENSLKISVRTDGSVLFFCFIKKGKNMSKQDIKCVRFSVNYTAVFCLRYE